VVVENVPWSTGKHHLCDIYRTDTQGLKLDELLQMNLRTVKAYLLKEDFQRFWNYTYPAWAEKFLHRWYFRTMRS
jgi:transposase